jgi:hypothetical protein
VAVAAIPEDVIIEMLARVQDPTSPFRCAAVCWRWRWLRLIAEPGLTWPPGALGPSILVFFAQRH